MMKFGDMLRLDIPLTNERVWRRRRDGAFPHRAEPLDWLASRGVYYQHSPKGRELSEAAGYDGYKYEGRNTFRIIPGICVISYQYGDLRKGPDAHLYSEPDVVHGPINGYYWFNEEQLDIAVLFQMTW